MHHYMPEIYWHDKQGLLSIDVQSRLSELSNSQANKFTGCGPYKLATASISVEKEVRIWEFRFEPAKGSHIFSLSVDFLANVSGHNATINVVRFSPNGELMASGDSDGLLFIWKYDGRKEEPTCPPLEGDDLPPNKESWSKMFRTPFRHDSDVTGLCWSPNSEQIAVVSNDDSISMYDLTNGKKMWMNKTFRHFPNGVVWDPRGKYIVTLSTDRRMDILDAAKGTRLRSCHSIDFPATEIGGILLPANNYKLFIDDQFVSFVRSPDFSPCGELLFVPCAHLAASHKNVYGTYIFKRSDFDRCRPSGFLPSNKATKMVKCSPILYELKDTKENYLALPYRVVFAVLTKYSVSIYDSQHHRPFAFIDNLQYEDLTCIAWTPDGKSLVISSLEGFNTFITLDPAELGRSIEPVVKVDSSPKLTAPKKPKKVVEKVEKEAENSPKVVITPKASKKKDKDEQTPTMTPTRVNTPNVSLYRFFTPKTDQKRPETESSSKENESATPSKENESGTTPKAETSAKESKPKKRVQLVQLD